MSIDHRLIRLAIRARASTLAVVTTGSASIGASSTGFTRSIGSFLTDGFEPGMELLASAFSPVVINGLSVIKEVTDLTMSVTRALASAAVASGKTLAVGLPSQFAYEDDEFTPTPGVPWIEEELVSGPQRRVTVDRNGWLEFDPIAHLWVHVPENSGPGALDRYADALLSQFRINTTITLSDGNLGFVRSEVGPYRGQIRHYKTGFASVRVTMNLRFRLANA